MHTHTRGRAHAHTRAWARACTHTHVHARMHACTHAHTHAHIHTCTHAHTHANTHAAPNRQNFPKPPPELGAICFWTKHMNGRHSDRQTREHGELVFDFALTVRNVIWISFLDETTFPFKFLVRRTRLSLKLLLGVASR